MSCEKYLELISASLDDEATDSEKVAVAQHVAGCTACRRRLAGQRALKHAVSRLAGRASPPEAVQARIEALRFGPRRKRGFRRLSYASLAAAALIAAVVGGRSWLVSHRGPSLSDELIADHMKYVPEAMPAEVASGDPSEVRRFFRGKVPFDPVVPRLEGAALLGGRLCRIRGDYEQLLFYERDGTKLSLYVTSQQRPSSCEGSRGYHLCGHRRGGLSWSLVGDASPNDLRALLESARL